MYTKLYMFIVDIFPLIKILIVVKLKMIFISTIVNGFWCSLLSFSGSEWSWAEWSAGRVVRYSGLGYRRTIEPSDQSLQIRTRRGHSPIPSPSSLPRVIHNLDETNQKFFIPLSISIWIQNRRKLNTEVLTFDFDLLFENNRTVLQCRNHPSQCSLYI